MGKLLERLEKQLQTEYKQDAEDCIKIYDGIKEATNKIWESDWRPLVNVIFKGYPSDGRRYKPTAIGYVFLRGLNKEKHEKTD